MILNFCSNFVHSCISKYRRAFSGSCEHFPTTAHCLTLILQQSIERSIAFYEAEAREIENERLRAQQAAELRVREEREALERQEQLRIQVQEQKQKQLEEEERKKKEAEEAKKQEEQRRKEEEERARREEEKEKNEGSMIVPKSPIREFLAYEALMKVSACFLNKFACS